MSTSIGFPIPYILITVKNVEKDAIPPPTKESDPVETRVKLAIPGNNGRKILANTIMHKFGEKLWRKDPTPWTTDPKQQESVVDGLGWLHVAEKALDLDQPEYAMLCYNKGWFVYFYFGLRP